MRVRVFLIAGLLLGIIGDEPWTLQATDVKARLRGLSVVTSSIVWTSGTSGTYALTTDGGRSWRSGVVPGAGELDFRDIHAVDARVAYALSAGEGEKSRIYKTTNGGQSWILQFRNREPKGFYDAIAFWDADHGIAMGDPLGGQFEILVTDDGGAHWDPIPEAGLPKALPKEGAFAASGTCLVTQGTANAWFATGGAANTRVFRSTDRGRTWTVATTPISAGAPSRGIFSLAFSDANHGVAVGGDYQAPEITERIVALTDDGGLSWRAAVGKPPGGYRSGVAWMPGTQTLVAVGPTGSDISTDGGATWTRLGTGGFHAIGFAAPDGPAWATGDDGRIAQFRADPLRPR